MLKMRNSLTIAAIRFDGDCCLKNRPKRPLVFNCLYWHQRFHSWSDFISFRIAGQPILWGYENVYCEGLIWKPRQDGSTQQPKTAIAFGMVIESVRLDKILEKILGDNLFSAAWFSEMTCSEYSLPLLVCFEDLKPFHFGICLPVVGFGETINLSLKK